MDRTHNPEFTVMEIYIAWKDYLWMMDFVEEMFEKVALDLHGTTKVTYGTAVLDFKVICRMTMQSAFSSIPVRMLVMNEDQLRTACRELGLETVPPWVKGAH
jgi:lysyl-tRNA synthetase class 2